MLSLPSLQTSKGCHLTYSNKVFSISLIPNSSLPTYSPVTPQPWSQGSWKFCRHRIFSKYTEGFCTFYALCLKCSSRSRICWVREVFLDQPLKNAATPLLHSISPFSAFFHPIVLQFSSVSQSCPTLCDPLNHSTPGLPVHHQLREFTQTHVHRVSDPIQPSRPQSSPSPPAPSPSQHQSLFQRVNSSHEVAKVLEFQL